MSKIKKIQLDISGKGYKSQQDRFYDEGGDICSIPATRTENKVNIIVDMKALYSNTTRGNAIKSNNNSPSLDHNCNIGIGSQKTIRQLTEIECERLQGFPDDWTKGIPKTQRYCSLGNAVSVPIVKMIIEKLYKNWL